MASTVRVTNLVLILVTLVFPSSLSCKSKSFPKHEKLNVRDALTSVTSLHSYMQKVTHNNPWTLPVLHVDFIRGTKHNTTQRFREKLHRDSKRVRALHRHMKKKNNQELYDSKVAGFESPVISGLVTGTGEYFTRIGVGTPSVEQYMVIDTGSDVPWMQCQPCSRCYNQLDTIFNPSMSTTFSSVPCNSVVCNYLTDGGCADGVCAYKVAYGDGSRTSGVLGSEILTFGSTIVQNVAIGCGHENVGLFEGAGGLLAMGFGQLSFPSQLGTQTGNVFSVCLVDRDTESASSLIFGPEGVPTNSIFAEILRNPAFPSFYYVSLAGIIVQGYLVRVPANSFEVGKEGDGGVIVDTGTAVTRLKVEAYEAVRNAFVSAAGNLPRTDGVALFDTCYNLGGFGQVSVPSVGFYFSNGLALMLPARNYMVPVDSLGTFCLAMAPSASGISIIGNIQLQHVRVSFDSAKSLVGFALDQC